MNKFTKASIAGGAAIALLLGGAGTLAYWNDSASVNAGIVTAGELSIESTGSAVWTVNNQIVTDPLNFRIVPGDILVLEQPLHVIAKGDNLKADLSVDYNSLVDVPQNVQGTALGIDILNAGNPSFGFESGLPTSQFTVSSAPVQGITTSTLTVTPGAAGIDRNVTATVTFTFPWGTAGDNNDTMDALLDLSKIGLILQQKA